MMDRRASTGDWNLLGAKRDPQTARRDPRGAVEQNIQGVFLRTYDPVVTSYGRLSEILRSEWLGDNKTVDQIFVSSLRPGKASAWHAHEVATDRLFAVNGTLLVALYDNRPGSPTRGVVQDFTLGTDNQSILIIPPKIWHGIKNISSEDVQIINAVDIAYVYENPDHWRLPPDTDEIPFRF